MKGVLAITGFALILVALLFSFTGALGLDELWPGFDNFKTVFVAVAFLILAIGGLFHRYHKFKGRARDD